MKRRNFLSLIGAAAVTPALPAFGAAPSSAVTAAVAGYNRYMYGLAVFYARSHAGITAADLMTRLGISSSQASAMMGEMASRGVLSSVTGAVTRTAHSAPRKPYVRKVLRALQDTTTDPETSGGTGENLMPQPDTQNTPTPEHDPQAGVSP